MILAIMQPYFFPYLGYFDLIHYSDQWVVFDTPQYIRHGWINRNRIQHPQQSWQYVIIPLKKHARDIKIYDIQISKEFNWRDRILGQVQHYNKSAPFFSDVYSLLSECLDVSEMSLSRLNIEILKRVCSYIGIPFNYTVFSEMNIYLDKITDPGDYALKIAQALGADEYVNPPGGEHLFQRSRFDDINVKLTIRKLPIFEYMCLGYDYCPNLSIIDVLMWNPTEKVLRFLKQNR